MAEPLGRYRPIKLTDTSDDYPPLMFISGSATNPYGDKNNAMVDENELPIIELSNALCARWEDLSLRRAARKPTRVYRAPAQAVKLFLGEAASLILCGQRAMPRRLTEAGFTFCFNELEAALTEIVNAV